MASAVQKSSARYRQFSEERQEALVERFARTVTIALGLYPIIWATGFAGIVMAALGVLSVLYLIQVKITRIALLPIGIALLNTLSIPIGMIAFDADVSRALSALFNAGVWMVIAGCLDAASKHDFRQELGGRLVFVLAVQAVLVIVALQIFPQRLPVPVFSEIAQRLPGAFGDLGRPDMVISSWIGRMEQRTSGLMSQAVAAGGFAGAAGLIVASLKNLPRWARILGVVAAAPVVYYSLSRTTYALVPLVLLVALCIAIAKRDALIAYGLVTVSALLGVAALLLWHEDLFATLDEVDDLRGGSSASRGAIYGATLSYVFAHPLPLLGYGIKPREEGLVASVGTHSTILGLSFRGGLVAAFLYVALIVALVARAIRKGDVTAAIATLFVGLWSVQADLDSGHIIPLLFAFAITPPPDHQSESAGLSIAPLVNGTGR